MIVKLHLYQQVILFLLTIYLDLRCQNKTTMIIIILGAVCVIAINLILFLIERSRTTDRHFKNYLNKYCKKVQD